MTNGTYLTQSNQWCVANNTTGAYTTTVKVSNASDTAIGTGVVLPQGTNNSTSCFIQTDGVTDVWFGNGYIGDNVTVGSISGGVQNRVTTPTIASSYTVNSDTTDVYLIIGQNEACSIDISAPSN